MKDISLAMLVLSCDKYADLWNGFFYQFQKYFNLEIPVYFASNKKTPKTNFPLKIILTGNEVSWGSNLKKILEQLNEKYIFITLEDLYLDSNFSNELFNEVINFISSAPVAVKHLKYSGVIYGKQMVSKHISKLPSGLPYRVTLCGIWDREYLLSIIEDDENPWQFEVNGSARNASSEGYYSLNIPICKTVNMVEKGTWIKKSVQWAFLNEIPLNIETRFFKSWHQEILCVIKQGYFNFILKTDISIRKKIVDLIKKILVIH